MKYTLHVNFIRSKQKTFDFEGFLPSIPYDKKASKKVALSSTVCMFILPSNSFLMGILVEGKHPLFSKHYFSSTSKYFVHNVRKKVLDDMGKITVRLNVTIVRTYRITVRLDRITISFENSIMLCYTL